MNKKTYKKYLNATIATAVVASVAPIAAPNVQASTSFSDVKSSDYFADAVNSLVERGVIKGFPDGTFKPNASVTRGQAAKIIAGVLGLDTKNVKNPGFKDVATSNEYYGAIAALANAGIINGYTDGTFKSTQPVQRNHMAKIIANAFSLKSSGATTPFTDVHKDYMNYVAALFENGVTTGRTTTTFDGFSNVTRGQLASFVIRAEGGKSATKDETAVVNTIKGIENGKVVTNAGTFEISEELAKVFSTENAAALKEAKVELVIEYNETATVASLNNFVAAARTGKVVGVKALTLVAENTSFNAGGYSIPQVTVNANTVEITGLKADKLTVGDGLQITLKTVEVKELAISASTKLTFDTNSKVEKLVLPEGSKLQDVITNYSQVKNVIKQAVDTKGTVVQGKTTGGGGGSSSSSGTDSSSGSDSGKDSESDSGSNGNNGVVTKGQEITTAGTYGPASGNQTIEGDLTISSKDVTLQNVTVKGNLILGAGIGEGDVHLNRVAVEGQTIVNGGGQNSVYFTDSVLATVIVNKNNGAVRIVAQGSTQVYEVQLETPTIVVEKDLDAEASGFEDIVLTEAMQSGYDVTLEGTFETINSRATDVRITLGNQTDIRTLILNAAAQVLGTGTIVTAQVNATGSTLAQSPRNVVLDINGSIRIGDTEVTESYSQHETTALNAIKASQGSIALELENFVAGLTTADFAVVAKIDDQEYELQNLKYNANRQLILFDPIALTDNVGKTVEITVSPDSSKVTGGAKKATFVIENGFAGRITDIQGVGIPNLTIKFRAGMGTRTGEVEKTVTTDRNGYYSVNLPAGTYTGEISSPGYMTTYIIGVSESNVFNMNENETAIRAAATNEVKIMLSWDKNPEDLDSHLTGPGSDNTPFHIAYYNKKEVQNGLTYVDLDWDDTDSYGPETTTIRKLVDGEYRFYIHHYSGISTLRSSGANINVYLGNSTTPDKTYNVPTGEGNERYWVVFDLKVSNNGETLEIVPVNTLLNHENPVLKVNNEIITYNGYEYEDYVRSHIYGEVNVTTNDTVELSASEGTTIHYELNYGEATIDSPVYTGPFKVTENTDIHAITVKDGVIVGELYADLIIEEQGTPGEETPLDPFSISFSSSNGEQYKISLEFQNLGNREVEVYRLEDKDYSLNQSRENDIFSFEDVKSELTHQIYIVKVGDETYQLTFDSELHPVVTNYIEQTAEEQAADFRIKYQDILSKSPSDVTEFDRGILSAIKVYRYNFDSDVQEILKSDYQKLEELLEAYIILKGSYPIEFYGYPVENGLYQANFTVFEDVESISIRKLGSAASYTLTTQDAGGVDMYTVTDQSENMLDAVLVVELNGKTAVIRIDGGLSYTDFFGTIKSDKEIYEFVFEQKHKDLLNLTNVTLDNEAAVQKAFDDYNQLPINVQEDPQMQTKYAKIKGFLVEIQAMKGNEQPGNEEPFSISVIELETDYQIELTFTEAQTTLDTVSFVEWSNTTQDTITLATADTTMFSFNMTELFADTVYYIETSKGFYKFFIDPEFNVRIEESTIYDLIADQIHIDVLNDEPFKNATSHDAARVAINQHLSESTRLKDGINTELIDTTVADEFILRVGRVNPDTGKIDTEFAETTIKLQQ